MTGGDEERPPARTFGVILVANGSAAFRAETLLRRAALAVRLVPVPRELSNACGVAVRVVWADCHRAEAVLREAGVPVIAVQRMEAG